MTANKLCGMDADNFPPKTRINDMAKGNSKKKTDGTAPVIRVIDANLGPRKADKLPAGFASKKMKDSICESI